MMEKADEEDHLIIEYRDMLSFAKCADFALSSILGMVELDEIFKQKCVLNDKVIEEIKAAADACQHIIDSNPFPPEKKHSEFVDNLAVRITEATLIETLRQNYKAKYGCEPEGYEIERGAE